MMSNKYTRDDEYCGLGACSWFTGDLREYIITEMNSEGRYYHNFSHVVSLASHFTADVNSDIAESINNNTNDVFDFMETEEEFDKLADIVLPAICFHDIVYNPHRGDNEEKSSAMAYLRLPPGLPIEQIQSAIMATKTHQAETLAEKVMCDVDMQILSTYWPCYLDYARNIRREYIHVPFDQYVAGRGSFLEKLLEKPIYHLPISLCDDNKAHANIRRELHHLNTNPKDFLIA